MIYVIRHARQAAQPACTYNSVLPVRDQTADFLTSRWQKNGADGFLEQIGDLNAPPGQSIEPGLSAFSHRLSRWRTH